MLQVTSLNLDQSNLTSVPAPVNDEDSKSEDNTSEESISLGEKSYLQKFIRIRLVETTKPVEIQRKDPNSPLYSVKTFDALHL